MSDPAAFEPQVSGLPHKAAGSDWLAFLQGHASAAGEFCPHPSLSGTEQAPTHSQAPVDDTEARIAEAFESGLAQGRAESLAAAEVEQGERRKLGIALRTLEGDLRDEFAAMLGATIQTLCEASFAPIALDGELLERRCQRAAAMLGEAQEAITLRLNPQDIARLDTEFRDSWTIAPDPDLPQGELRAEGRDGAVLDGPREWARILSEALETC